MEELRTILIVAGAVIVLLVWGVSYYRKHKHIRSEMDDFNRHADDIDDVLLSSSNKTSEDQADDPYAGFSEIISGPRTVSSSNTKTNSNTESSVAHTVENSDNQSDGKTISYSINTSNVEKKLSVQDKISNDTDANQLNANPSETNEISFNQTSGDAELELPESFSTQTSADNSDTLESLSTSITTEVDDKLDTETVLKSDDKRETQFESVQEPEPEHAAEAQEDSAAASLSTTVDKVIAPDAAGLSGKSVTSEKPVSSDAKNSSTGSESVAGEKASPSHDQSHSHASQIRIQYQQLPEGVNELIVAILIKAKDELIAGDAILAATNEVGLEFGEMGIFHYAYEPKQTGQLDIIASSERVALFSMANMMEPGTFDINNMSALQTPGLTLFQRFPCCTKGLEAYEQMVDLAYKLAEKLDAELLDESRSVLTQQTVTHTKERIREHQFAIDKAVKKAQYA